MADECQSVCLLKFPSILSNISENGDLTTCRLFSGSKTDCTEAGGGGGRGGGTESTFLTFLLALNSADPTEILIHVYTHDICNYAWNGVSIFYDFVWVRAAKLCLSSLVQGQVSQLSEAHSNEVDKPT